MRYGIACGLLLLLLLSLAPSTNAQDVPGNVYLGTPSILLASYVDVCLPPEWGPVTVYATEPLEPVKSVRFQVTWPAGVDHDPGSVPTWQGAVDVSAPGDDVWEIEFQECLDSPGRTLYLVSYGGVDYHGQTGWMCPFGDQVPRPVWTLCSGETIEAPLFDVGPDWVDGCTPYGSYDCWVIPTPSQSWGMLKSSY